MVWAWMHWPRDALVAWTFMVWAWMHWPVDAFVAWTLSWFGHGCTGQGMPWQHGRYHGLGMDALASGCLCSRDVIMVWAWMHWPVDALVAWTLSWFGHGCTGQGMPW